MLYLFEVKRIVDLGDTIVFILLHSSSYWFHVNKCEVILNGGGSYRVVPTEVVGGWEKICDLSTVCYYV